LRLGMAWTIGVWGLHDPVVRRKLWLIPIRDALNFLVWVAAFFSSKVSWRGKEYLVKERNLIPVISMRNGSGASSVEAQSPILWLPQEEERAPLINVHSD